MTYLEGSDEAVDETTQVCRLLDINPWALVANKS
jgi:hypothetical protein